eukprot:10383293-Ditylum_brightwellii.AAC.1
MGREDKMTESERASTLICCTNLYFTGFASSDDLLTRTPMQWEMEPENKSRYGSGFKQRKGLRLI